MKTVINIYLKLDFEWDEDKRQSNLLKHGLDFEDARYFFDEPSIFKLDIRFNYGEKRYVSVGKVFNRTVVLIFSKPSLNSIRIISFRKANFRESRYYDETLKNKLEKS